MSKPEDGVDAAVATKALDALEEAAKEVEDLAWPALREAARVFAAAWDDYRDPSRQARAQARLEDAARAFVAADVQEPHERGAYSIEQALSEFAAEVKVKVTANTRAAGYVELHHLYGLLDPIIKATP